MVSNLNPSPLPFPPPQLSPSKTWEGFVGGALSTVAVSWFLSKWLSQYDWLVCPRDDLTGVTRSNYY